MEIVTCDERFCTQNEARISGTEKVVTLSKISLRSISQFSILLAQNDRPVRSFRLWGHSTSSLFKKYLWNPIGVLVDGGPTIY